MPAKTPVAKGNANWVDPATATVNLAGTAIPNTDPNRRTYYFADIDDGDTFATGVDVVEEAWWVPDTATDAVSVSQSTGTITFETDGSDKAGYLVYKAPL